jgi:hypothetical protein
LDFGLFLVQAPTPLVLCRETRPPQWLPLVGGTNLKDATHSCSKRWRSLSQRSYAAGFTLRYRQSKIPKLHPFMGAVNLNSKIQNLKLIDHT